MPVVTGLGNTWNLPNYAGELFSADPSQTPLLSMVGGLTGGKQTDNFEFPTAVLFDYPAAAQPSISEKDSESAPAGNQIAREQETNVVQIHQETIHLSYAKQSNSGRISGISPSGDFASIQDEKAFQVQHKLIKIARDVEHSFINGKYKKSTAYDEPNQTRGLLELCDAGTTLDASSGELDKDMLNTIYRMMANNGAYFTNMVMFVGAYQKQKITDIYASQFRATMLTTAEIGGLNISQVETDFFKMGVVWDRFMPPDAVLIADVGHISPVFQMVPGKGVLFEEELAKTGASDKIQIYGQVGLAHGPAFLHASITGLADS